MKRFAFPLVALCMFFSSCPQLAQEAALEHAPKAASSISYCSGGLRWEPGHSAPSGACPDPQVVTSGLGDMA